MIKTPSTAMALLLVPWLACTNQATTDNAKQIATSSETGKAGMILPDVKDTVLPSGRHNIYLAGNRTKPGFFVERSTFPAGYRGLPHIHNGDLYVTIIAGSAYMVMGTQFDTTLAVKPYGPGSFVIIPADQPHYEWFKEACTMQIEGIGPNETFYVSDSTSRSKASGR